VEAIVKLRTKLRKQVNKAYAKKIIGTKLYNKHLDLIPLMDESQLEECINVFTGLGYK